MASGRPRTIGKKALARDRLIEVTNIAAEMRLGGATLEEIGKICRIKILGSYERAL